MRRSLNSNSTTFEWWPLLAYLIFVEWFEAFLLNANSRKISLYQNGNFKDRTAGQLYLFIHSSIQPLRLCASVKETHFDVDLSKLSAYHFPFFAASLDHIFGIIIITLKMQARGRAQGNCPQNSVLPPPKCDVKHCLTNLKHQYIGAKGAFCGLKICQSAFPDPARKAHNTPLAI